MKRCPQCKAEYFDNLLEFCLEDGTRLSFAADTTAASRGKSAADTVPLGGPLATAASEETIVIPPPVSVQSPARKPDLIEEKVSTYFDYFPLAVALMHNWWQWIYLEKTYVYSITDYILSANFLMWLLLLRVGVVGGIYSFKRSNNKTLALISLVTLAINLILFLVPRR